MVRAPCYPLFVSVCLLSVCPVELVCRCLSVYSKHSILSNCYEPRNILVPSITFAAMAATSINSGSPYTTLTAAFLSWKAVLFAIAAGSRVGPTYDTSSSLLVPGSPPTLLTRLSSWDAIYFLKAAQRGYLFEQEWAFGSALPNCVSLIIRGNARSSCLTVRPSFKTKSKLLITSLSPTDPSARPAHFPRSQHSH